MLCGSLDGRGVWRKMDICIYIAESLHCSPETITTLLIGYTPIQNKKFFFFLIASIGEEVGKLVSLCTTDGIINWFSY